LYISLYKTTTEQGCANWSELRAEQQGFNCQPGNCFQLSLHVQTRPGAWRDFQDDRRAWLNIHFHPEWRLVGFTLS